MLKVVKVDNKVMNYALDMCWKSARWTESKRKPPRELGVHVVSESVGENFCYTRKGNSRSTLTWFGSFLENKKRLSIPLSLFFWLFKRTGLKEILHWKIRARPRRSSAVRSLIICLIRWLISLKVPSSDIPSFIMNTVSFSFDILACLELVLQSTDDHLFALKKD